MESDRITTTSADSQRLSLLGWAVIYLIAGVIVLNFARIILTSVSAHLGWSGQTAQLVYFVPLLTVLVVNGYTVLRIGDRLVCLAYLLMAICLIVDQLIGLTDGELVEDLQAGLESTVYVLLAIIFYRVIRLLMNTDQQRKQRLLENLAWGTSHRVGTDFLAGLVTTIVDTLNVQVAFVSEVDSESDREVIVSAAAGADGQVPEPLQPGSLVECSEEKLGRTIPRQSVYLIELTDADECAIGHLSLFHPESSDISPGQRSSLQVFASRASAELLRIRADRKSDEMEARMLQVQKLESLGVLAGGIAHDFNNLLHAIRNYAAIAGKPPLDEQTTCTAMGQIEEIVDKGATMCSRLLAYAGRAVRSDDICRINEIVRETTGIIQAARADCHMTLELSSAPLFVWGDATQLSQVVMNLLTNAADAVDADDGLIEIRTEVGGADAPTAEGMQLTGDGEFAFIEVSDNGCGIADDAVMKIFDPFYTSKGKGRGIGLAAVVGIVRDHQGDIAIRTQRTQGTTFVVALPVTDQTPESTQSQATPMHDSTVGMDILLVDDDELVRSSTQLLLEVSSIRVTTAESGNKALLLFDESDTTFDCILLDQTMPGLSGLETCRRLRETGVNTPVVLMSGYSEVGLDDDMQNVRFLSKPCSRNDLLAAISDAVDAGCPATSN